MNDIWARFKIKKLLIKDFNYWYVVLRKKQITLASSVILLKNEKSSLGDLDLNEMGEFIKISQWYEKIVKKEFRAKKFNYIAAMMKDPFVHFHCIPRYSNTIDLFDRKWEDKDWPKLVNFSSELTDESVLDSLVQLLRRRTN